MRSAGNETVLVKIPVQRDDFGDPIPGTGQDVTHKGCAVWPRGSTEASGREQTVITGYTLIVPDIEAAITDDSVITWRGRDYEVEGEPGIWTFLDGTPAGLQIALKRAKG